MYIIRAEYYELSLRYIPGSGVPFLFTVLSPICVLGYITVPIIGIRVIGAHVLLSLLN